MKNHNREQHDRLSQQFAWEHLERWPPLCIPVFEVFWFPCDDYEQAGPAAPK